MMHADVSDYSHIGRPRGPLDAKAWDERYRTGDTPWDKGEPSPGLVDFLAQEKYTPGTVLVPGCGRGYDCQELARHGFEVTGLDLCNVAFADAAAAAPSVRFIVGDFLTHTGQYDLVFEHTCFCAIHPDLRDPYVESAARVLKPGGHLLGIFYNIRTEEGPPFGTTRAELWERFSPRFELVSEKVPRSWPSREGEELLLLWRRRQLAA
jgi:methyl halide transferase